MTTEEKLDTILTTLTEFIARQEAFNARQEAFNARQEAFNARQEAFNARQEAFNARQEAFNAKQEGVNSRLEMAIESLRQDMAEFRHQEELQHNATHRLIMQAFEHINEMKGKQPWEK